MHRYQIITRRSDNRLNEQWATRVKKRFLELNNVMDIRLFFSGWFLGAPFDSIKKGNVEDFVAYGFYCRTMDNLPAKVCSQHDNCVASSDSIYCHNSAY